MIASLKQSATDEFYYDKDDFIGLRDFKKHCDKRDTKLVRPKLKSPCLCVREVDKSSLKMSLAFSMVNH